VTRGHLVLGRDAEVIGETAGGIEVVSRVRLRPGFMVHVVFPPAATRGTASRPALVVSWWIRAVGSDGTTYRGFCRWDTPTGHSLPAALDSAAENLGDG
jgi:hypothetical protein